MRKISGSVAIICSLLMMLTFVLPASVNAATQISYPTSINGFPVILVETSANDVSLPAGQVTLVLLDNISNTLLESSAKLNLNSYLINNPLASNWSFEVYGGLGVTKDEIINNQAANNEWQKQHGLIKLGPIQSGISPMNTAGPFQVDMFNDPATKNLNLQMVNIVAPTITGNYEDSYAYFGNNVFTNTNYFLQSGQLYANGSSRIVWADTSVNCVAQTFSVSYRGGNNYCHQIFYNSAGSGSYSNWDMGVVVGSSYAYHVENHATGTLLKQDINDSVFFENYNIHNNWYQGFSGSTVSATNAWEGYGSVVNGSWTGWESAFSSDTLYNNIYGAMSGSLANWGTTYWTLSNIPRGTNP